MEGSLAWTGLKVRAFFEALGGLKDPVGTGKFPSERLCRADEEASPDGSTYLTDSHRLKSIGGLSHTKTRNVLSEELRVSRERPSLIWHGPRCVRNSVTSLAGDLPPVHAILQWHARPHNSIITLLDARPRSRDPEEKNSTHERKPFVRHMLPSHCRGNDSSSSTRLGPQK